MKAKSATHYWSLILLIGITCIWGTTFPLLKDAVNTLSPMTLISTRFVVAAVAFLPFCRRFQRQLLQDGMILGVLSFIAYITQVIGLETTSSNRAAFITSLNVILVPILGVVLGRSIAPKIILAAALALIGIGIMSWEAGALVIGDLWILGCALSYAIYILFLEAIAPKYSPVAITTIQLLTIAIMATLWSLPNWLNEWQAIQANFGVIIYLGLMATAITTWVQAIAQRRISATETAIIYTLEPVFAAIFALVLLNERLGSQGLLGASMVLIAMLVSQISLRQPKSQT